MELKRTKVHMLPTGDKSNIGLNTDNELIYSNHKESTFHSNVVMQHLYFTTDEVIKKKGDYYIGIKSLLGRPEVLQCDKDGEYLAKKIIASTDKSLGLVKGLEKGKIYNEIFVDTKFEPTKQLPQPYQAFIEKYCKLGGIEYVDVEYEVIMSTEIYFDGVSEFIPKVINQKLKVDKHNIVTIREIKSSWSRDDKDLIKAFEDFAAAVFNKNYGKDSSFTERAEMMSKQWINENL